MKEQFQATVESVDVFDHGVVRITAVHDGHRIVLNLPVELKGEDFPTQERGLLREELAYTVGDVLTVTVEGGK